MNAGFSKLEKWFWVATLIFGLALAFFFFWERSYSLEDWSDFASKALSRDFQQEVSRLEKMGEEQIKVLPAHIPFPSKDKAIFLLFDERNRLIQWSDAEKMPSARRLPELAIHPTHTLFSANNKSFFVIRKSQRGFTWIGLIPLLRNYPVSNLNLPTYAYLGRFSEFPIISQNIGPIKFSTQPKAGIISVLDSKGTFVYGIEVQNPEVFSYPFRERIFVGFWTWFFCIMVGLFARAYRKNRAWPLWVFFGLSLTLKLFFILFSLPNAYVPTRLFSPMLLAISNFSPSLGDLLFNVGLLISLYLALRKTVPRFFEKFPSALTLHPFTQWFFALGGLVISSILGPWYILFLARIIPNSKINFDFSNPFSLNIWSFFGLALAGMLVALIAFICLDSLTQAWKLGRKWSRKWKWLAWPLAITLVALIGFWTAQGALWVLLVSFSFLAFLSLVVVRTRGLSNLKVDLPNFLLLTLAFSLISTAGIALGLEKLKKAELELLAERHADDHDLITESQFQRVVRAAEDQAYLLQFSSVPDISNWLMETFFESNFKGYEVRVFVYDEKWKCISQNSAYEPYLEPNSELSIREVGTPTLAPNLYLVPYYHGLFESIYLGQFKLFLKDPGPVTIQVELFPTEFRTNRLYPQLVLDEQVRAKSIVPQGYEFAIYKDGRLFRKQGKGSFPLVYEGPTSDSALHQFVENGSELSLFHSSLGQKVIVTRTEDVGMWGAANLFSFIFYLFVLGLLLALLPWFFYRVIKSRGKMLYLGLRGRIQFFFLLISVVPLVVVIFFISPYVEEKIHQQYLENLRAETSRVANMIREDYVVNRRSGIDAPATSKLLKDRLTEIENTLFTDINIFYHNGLLHLTTQKSVFEMGLTGEFMNPVVYDRMKTGLESDAVIEDRIGNVSFFSGYVPLLNNDRKIIGFLNIPFLKNQDQANEQVLSLLTFLVNIYVVLFLGIGILAVILANGIVRPLNLLSQRLAATNLGQANTPVQWETQDELGEIIRAYNQMLEKLAESEKKLAQNEREMAWKEMARQVAHEIKNPLTPMRLSVQHLIRSWKEDSPNLEKLFEKVTNTILVQVDQLVNIANSFSEFARMPEPNRTTFPLQEVVSEVFGLYEHSEGVHLEIHLPADAFFVNSDRDQLSRVFNNLIKNAIQAMGEHKGEISVGMKVEHGVARVSVSDNGSGIPDEIRNKIFQPNFSTKTSGMGLGLAMVKKIIESAGGSIYFETEVGKGTTFFVELPQAVSVQ